MSRHAHPRLRRVAVLAAALALHAVGCTAEQDDPAEGWVIMVREDAGVGAHADGGGVADAGGLDAGARDGGAALYQACLVDADCESGVCHTFNRVGTVCTRNCLSAEDCGMAGVTCNNRGLCRPP